MSAPYDTEDVIFHDISPFSKDEHNDPEGVLQSFSKDEYNPSDYNPSDYDDTAPYDAEIRNLIGPVATHLYNNTSNIFIDSETGEINTKFWRRIGAKTSDIPIGRNFAHMEYIERKNTPEGDCEPRRTVNHLSSRDANIMKSILVPNENTWFVSDWAVKTMTPAHALLFFRFSFLSLGSE